MRLDGETRLFPIIGDPIVYARSPELLTASLRTRGANAACVPLEVPRDALDPVMSGLSASRNVDGILVTMPHKHAVTAHCATLSETSRLLGAVSVIRRNEDGSWHGDSQDGSSFVKAQIDQGAVVEGSRVLLFGAGGAGSAIAIALLAGGARELVIHDIDETRVRDLIRLLGDRADGRAHHGPPDPRGCAMLCHATHLGMAEGDAMPIDPGLLDPSIFVGDVIAGHGVTPLIQAARDAGCRTATGDQMVEAVQSMMVDFMLGAWTEDHAGRE